MLQYYWDRGVGRYRVDRRRTQITTATDNRRQETATFTSQQYTHLRQCLEQRQRVKAILGDRERRARHLLYAATAGFIAYVFAGPDFTFAVQGISITARQVAALIPLVIAYLVVYACHTGATHLRVRYECQLLDAELEKFGLPTSHSIIRRLRSECSPRNPSIGTYFSTLAYRTVYVIHDFFFAASVALALVGSGFVAVGIYGDLVQAKGPIAIAFIAYLGLAGLAAVVAPSILRYARRTRQLALDRYVMKGSPDAS